MTDDTKIGGQTALLRSIRRLGPADVTDTMAAAAAELGATDVVVYVVDFEQQVLEPLPDMSTHEELPHSEDVRSTVAGRAFLQRRAAQVPRVDGVRVWVPILEGSDATGVLALTIKEADEAMLDACEDLGVLTGYLIATQARVTDLYGLHRRRKSMTLAASMQWDLLPPLTLTSPRVSVAGLVEPAYEVGGDCFDYALNGPHLDAIFMDSMGHGLQSAMVAALAMGCYRHRRREGRMLDLIHDDLDQTIARYTAGEGFVTGDLLRLDLTTGVMTWINAGHPLPLLVRHGQVVGPIEAKPEFPWGLGLGKAEDLVSTALEPDDTVFFFTDGVTDARRGNGEDFGVDRLIDLLGQHASDQVPTAHIVRLVIQAVLEHHGGRLNDDATLLSIQWRGPGQG